MQRNPQKQPIITLSTIEECARVELDINFGRKSIPELLQSYESEAAWDNTISTGGLNPRHLEILYLDNLIKAAKERMKKLEKAGISLGQATVLITNLESHINKGE